MRARKWLSVLLAGTMMMSVLAGCGGGKKDPTYGSDIVWTDQGDGLASGACTITVEHGTIDGQSHAAVKVDEYGNVTFTVKADDGYLVSDILVNGVSIIGPESGLPKETVEVTLKDISHDVTVVCVEKTYRVTLSAGAGGRVQTNNNVKHNEDAFVIVTPNSDKQYKVMVTAAMGGKDVTSSLVPTTENGRMTYTLSKVTGDVAFDVTFTEALVESVDIIGTPKKEYKVGESFDPEGLTAQVKYDNGNTVLVPLTKENTTIEPAVLAKGVNEVKVTYENGGKSDQEIYQVTANTLSKEETGAIEQAFVDKDGEYVTFCKDAKVIAKLKEAKYVFDTAFVEINGKTYGVNKKEVGLENGLDEVLNAVDGFYNNQVYHAVNDGWTKDVDVYMEIDQTKDICTMWVVY